MSRLTPASVPTESGAGDGLGLAWLCHCRLLSPWACHLSDADRSGCCTWLSWILALRFVLGAPGPQPSIRCSWCCCDKPSNKSVQLLSCPHRHSAQRCIHLRHCAESVAPSLPWHRACPVGWGGQGCLLFMLCGPLASDPWQGSQVAHASAGHIPLAGKTWPLSWEQQTSILRQLVALITDTFVCQHLERSLNDFGQPWELNPGDGAFYGPKVSGGKGQMPGLCCWAGLRTAPLMGTYSGSGLGVVWSLPPLSCTELALWFPSRDVGSKHAHTWVYGCTCTYTWVHARVRARRKGAFNSTHIQLERVPPCSPGMGPLSHTSSGSSCLNYRVFPGPR